MAAQYKGKVSFLVPGPGLSVSGTLQTSGSTAQNATSIVLTGTVSLTGWINYGDTFTISGTLYTCTASTATGSNLVTVPVTPKVPSTITTGTAATGYAATRYAQDQVFLAPAISSVGIGNTSLLGVTGCVTALTTGATMELWLWDPSATDYVTLTNYKLGVASWLSALGSTTTALASYPAALLRCKSDGTHGDTIGTPGTTFMYSAD